MVSAGLARAQLPMLWELLRAEGAGPVSAHVLYVWEDDALELRLGGITFRYREKSLWDWPPRAGGHDPYRAAVLEWFKRLEWRVAAERAKAWLGALKEGIVAAAFAPARVERWMEAGCEPEAM